MWIGRELAGGCLFVVALAACEGPRVLPALPTSCTEYCENGTGCDRDCVHACEVGLSLCPAEWNAALACETSKASCDRDYGLPVAPQGCEAQFAAATDCAPHASCASEESFELCHGCCASFERDGSMLWQAAFRDCACASCEPECGSLYCGTDSGGEVECQSCTARYCVETVTSACAADDSCNRYDLCVAGCPVDDSSHCNEHPTFDACYACCVAEFTEGASRFDELLVDCACGACEPDCYDSELCEGFDLTGARCEACLESTCQATLDQTCGGEPRCRAFMACTAACE